MEWKDDLRSMIAAAMDVAEASGFEAGLFETYTFRSFLARRLDVPEERLPLADLEKHLIYQGLADRDDLKGMMRFSE